MELIKQLDEMANTKMNEETFGRLVKYAWHEIEDFELKHTRQMTKDEMLEIIHGMVENIAGFEETADAVALTNKVLDRVKHNMSV